MLAKKLRCTLNFSYKFIDCLLGKSDSIKSLVTMETDADRPHPRSLIISDENVLDLSANNTLSFVYTQPPKQTFLSVVVCFLKRVVL